MDEMLEQTNPAQLFEDGSRDGDAVPAPGGGEQPDSGQAIRVKYNGREQEIPMDQAAELVQKGLNYDHVLAERDSRYSRELELLDRYAAGANMSRRQLVEYLEQEAGRRETEPQSPQGSGRQDEMLQRWHSFFERYPDVKSEDIPGEVYRAVDGGLSPLEAYQKHQLDEMGRELSVFQKEKQNRASAVGSARGDAGGGEKDPFLDGFMGGD